MTTGVTASWQVNTMHAREWRWTTPDWTERASQSDVKPKAEWWWTAAYRSKSPFLGECIPHGIDGENSRGLSLLLLREKLDAVVDLQHALVSPHTEDLVLPSLDHVLEDSELRIAGLSNRGLDNCGDGAPPVVWLIRVDHLCGLGEIAQSDGREAGCETGHALVMCVHIDPFTAVASPAQASTSLLGLLATANAEKDWDVMTELGGEDIDHRPAAPLELRHSKNDSDEKSDVVGLAWIRAALLDELLHRHLRQHVDSINECDWEMLLIETDRWIWEELIAWCEEKRGWISGRNAKDWSIHAAIWEQRGAYNANYRISLQRSQR